MFHVDVSSAERILIIVAGDRSRGCSQAHADAWGCNHGTRLPIRLFPLLSCLGHVHPSSISNHIPRLHVIRCILAAGDESRSPFRILQYISRMSSFLSRFCPGPSDSSTVHDHIPDTSHREAPLVTPPPPRRSSRSRHSQSSSWISSLAKTLIRRIRPESPSVENGLLGVHSADKLTIGVDEAISQYPFTSSCPLGGRPDGVLRQERENSKGHVSTLLIVPEHEFKRLAPDITSLAHKAKTTDGMVTTVLGGTAHPLRAQDVTETAAASLQDRRRAGLTGRHLTLIECHGATDSKAGPDAPLHLSLSRHADETNGGFVPVDTVLDSLASIQSGDQDTQEGDHDVVVLCCSGGKAARQHASRRSAMTLQDRESSSRMNVLSLCGPDENLNVMDEQRFMKRALRLVSAQSQDGASENSEYWQDRLSATDMIIKLLGSSQPSVLPLRPSIATWAGELFEPETIRQEQIRSGDSGFTRQEQEQLMRDWGSALGARTVHKAVSNFNNPERLASLTSNTAINDVNAMILAARGPNSRRDTETGKMRARSQAKLRWTSALSLAGPSCRSLHPSEVSIA